MEAEIDDWGTMGRRVRILDNLSRPGIKQNLVRAALTQFYQIREVPGLKKKPSTSELIDWIADYRARIPELPVQAQTRPGEVAGKLPRNAPEEAEPFSRLLADLDSIVVPGVTQVQHPRYFGWFPANSTLSSALGDLASAGIGALGYPGQPTHPICHGVGARAHEPPYAHQAGGVAAFGSVVQPPKPAMAAAAGIRTSRIVPSMSRTADSRRSRSRVACCGRRAGRSSP